jgi:hypothetical protein
MRQCAVAVLCRDAAPFARLGNFKTVSGISSRMTLSLNSFVTMDLDLKRGLLGINMQVQVVQLPSSSTHLASSSLPPT